MIKLTGIPNPDYNDGKPMPVYVDETRILVIETGAHAFRVKGSAEEHRQAWQRLFQEIETATGALARMNVSLVADNEEEAKKAIHWVKARETITHLMQAYHAIGRMATEPSLYPEMKCTILSLACGTALEHGVMLTRVFVLETPEEVAQAIFAGRIRGPALAV